MWDRNCELCWGVGQESGMWGSMGKVWKGVWGECGGCVEVEKSVLGCGAVWGCGGANTLFYTSTHILHTHPTPHPTPLLRTPTRLTQHVSPHFSTLTSHLPTSLILPHTPHTFPSSPPTLSRTHSPYFLTIPMPPPTLLYAPYTLSFTPC